MNQRADKVNRDLGGSPIWTPKDQTDALVFGSWRRDDISHPDSSFLDVLAEVYSYYEVMLRLFQQAPWAGRQRYPEGESWSGPKAQIQSHVMGLGGMGPERLGLGGAGGACGRRHQEGPSQRAR